MDPYPDARSLEALLRYGVTETSEIYFLSDGEEGLRKYQWPFSRNTTYILDWFHLAMRFTVLGQLAKGIGQEDAAAGEKLAKDLERAKWKLWHGTNFAATVCLETLDYGTLPRDHPKVVRMRKAVEDFLHYLDVNSDMLSNYGWFYRVERPISTAFVESAVNSLVRKRMSKKQQMGWTPEGAHHLLQARVLTLNREIEATFRRSYPGLAAA